VTTYSPTSAIVDIQKARMEFFVEKVIEKVEDEPNDADDVDINELDFSMEQPEVASGCFCMDTVQHRSKALDKYENGALMEDFPVASYPYATTDGRWPPYLTIEKLDYAIETKPSVAIVPTTSLFSFFSPPKTQPPPPPTISQKTDDWSTFESRFDYVMVFPMKKGLDEMEREQSKEARVCIDTMLKKGLHLFT
jgi:hypothetical protein